MPVYPRHYSFKRLETDRELRRRVMWHEQYKHLESNV